MSLLGCITHEGKIYSRCNAEISIFDLRLNFPISNLFYCPWPIVVDCPPVHPTFCCLLSPLPAEKALEQNKGRTRREGYAIGGSKRLGKEDHRKKLGKQEGSVEEQKTSKVYLTVLRRPGVLEGRPAREDTV